MTPDEHYREAERLLAAAPDLSEDAPVLLVAAAILARAQVHATLATLGMRQDG